MSAASHRADGFDRAQVREFDANREACETCRFWHPDAGTIRDGKKGNLSELGFGFCRRRPPQLINHLVAIVAPPPSIRDDRQDLEQRFGPAEHFDATAFPGTFHGEWCGEFEWLPSLQPVELPV